MNILFLACAVYLATLSLGVSVQYAHVRLGRWRVVHHWLYALTWLATLGALVYGLATGAAWRWLPLLIVPVLAAFPRQRAANSSHRRLGLVGVLVWALILGWARLLG